MKRILFVDDEPKVLDGLQRILRPHRNEWEMEFVASGDEALARLEAAAFDVLVSDMRMPGMDGATLLKHVQQRFPNVIRIVLTGHTELEAGLRAIAIAHQFLVKPCEAAVLKEVVERAVGLHALLGDENLRRMVGEIDTLPTLPRVYSDLTRALADPDASLVAVSGIVEQDPGICAKVLQLVNSAFFALPRRITSVQTAVGALGMTMLKNLALSVEVFRAFEARGAATGFSLEAVQRHALFTAAIARRLVPDKRAAEDAFTAAMLHDVGKLILASRAPEHFTHLLALVRERQQPMHEVETELHGVTHAEVGAYLLGLWGLPYCIVEAVANHHRPARVTPQLEFGVMGAVHVADALAYGEAQPGPDLAYLESVGAAGRLPEWRALAEGLAAPAAA
jgi:putative nucleotidyltransferase with HDIG domain